MLELHLEFIDGARECFPEHPDFERIALISIYLWLREHLESGSLPNDDHRYCNCPGRVVVRIQATTVRRSQLLLDGEDVGDRVARGEMV